MYIFLGTWTLPIALYDFQAGCVLKKLDTYEYSSEVLRYSDNGQVFLAYRRQPAQFLLWVLDVNNSYTVCSGFFLCGEKNHFFYKINVDV